MLEGPIHRLLAVRLDNAGDVILLGPALRALREGYPDASITLLTSPAGAAAAALLPYIDQVLVHRASWQQLEAGAVEPASELRLVEQLRAQHFDAAFVFTSFAQSPVAPAYACYLAAIPVRAAYRPDAFSGEVVTHPIDPASAPPHQAERNLYLVEQLGITASRRDLEIALPPEATEEACERLGGAGVSEPFLTIAPGASAPARRYPAERFGQVARALARSHQVRVVIIGSEGERPLAEAMLEVARDDLVVSLAGETTVAGAAAVIARSSLVIANNSLSMHLADALGVPVVATYAGTDPVAYWRPRAVDARILTVEVPCAPCFRIDCDRDHGCLDLAPDHVVRAAEAMLPS